MRTVNSGSYTFGLKNAPSEFQNMMNEIFNEYTRFSIVYIDDVLIFSNSIEEHFKHLKNFEKLVREWISYLSHKNQIVSNKY